MSWKIAKSSFFCDKSWRKIAFGLVFVPRIIDRVKNDDVSRSESRSLKLDNFEKNIEPLPYLLVNNERKKVPDFKFINQNEKLVSNKDYLGKVYIVEFFFTKKIYTKGLSMTLLVILLSDCVNKSWTKLFLRSIDSNCKRSFWFPNE